MSDLPGEFEEEEPTPRWSESMEQIMLTLDAHLEETVRSPGIPTLTSNKPTRQIRPMVINNYEE